MTDASPLFRPLTVGAWSLPNRAIMAPMTRGRATPEGVPTPRMATYYAQRATAGLIITEATAISPQGVGWYRAPGIWTDAMVEAWKPVTAAVHAEGGRIVLQLWHMGRVSHPDFQGGELPVGPSAIAAEGQSHTPEGTKPYVTPRALDGGELPGIVRDYVTAARNAVAAGFDGVEIHAANGYLLDQFIKDGSNQRSDAYGGSIEARWKLPLEVTAAVAEAIGADRTGIRLSPTGSYNGMSDSDPVASFTYGTRALSSLGLAYVHVIAARPGSMMHNPDAPEMLETLRASTTVPLITNGGHDAASAGEVLGAEHADMVAFGVPFLANPDLVARWQGGAELNAPDMATFYAGDDQGYIDYPSL